MPVKHNVLNVKASVGSFSLIVKSSRTFVWSSILHHPGFDKSEKRPVEKTSGPSTASSVVMALIRFYDKSRARVPAAALTANPVRNNQEDTVSPRHHIPASDTDQRELKINCGKIVSGGTNVTNFGVAPGRRIVNTSSPKIENFHHNFQDRNVLLKKKNNSSALKISGSIKNNSMDEFLLLVKKTKQKYRDLLEKDFEKQRRNESFKKMKSESHQNNNLDVQAKNNLHSQVKNIISCLFCFIFYFYVYNVLLTI